MIDSAKKQVRPHGSGTPIVELVKRDLDARAAAGVKKYGEPLMANNGRDPLLDAYQEVLDLSKYLRQEIEERCAKMVPMAVTGTLLDRAKGKEDAIHELCRPVIEFMAAQDIHTIEINMKETSCSVRMDARK